MVGGAPKAQSRRKEEKKNHQAKQGHLSKLGRSKTDVEKTSHPGLTWGP